MKITLPTNMKAVLDVKVIIDGDEVDVLYRMRPGAENIDDELLDEAALFCLQFINLKFSLSKFVFTMAVMAAIRKLKIRIGRMGRNFRLPGTLNEILDRRQRDRNSQK